MITRIYMHREFCGGQGVFCPPELARNDELTLSQQAVLNSQLKYWPLCIFAAYNLCCRKSLHTLQ